MSDFSIENLKENYIKEFFGEEKPKEDIILESKKEEIKQEDNKKDVKEKIKQETKQEDWESKVKALEKSSLDNRRNFRIESQKVSDALKQIDSLLENSDIEEEAAEKLKTILSKNIDKVESFKEKEEKQEYINPIHKYTERITDDIVTTYIEITGDKDLYSKGQAFDEFISNLSPKELKDLEAEMEKLTPIQTLKKVMSVGAKILEEGYGDFITSASDYKKFKSYKSSVSAEIEKLKKELEEAHKIIDKHKEDSYSAGGWLGGSSKNYKEEVDSGELSIENLSKNFMAEQIKRYRK